MKKFIFVAALTIFCSKISFGQDLKEMIYQNRFAGVYKDSIYVQVLSISGGSKGRAASPNFLKEIVDSYFKIKDRKLMINFPLDYDCSGSNEVFSPISDEPCLVSVMFIDQNTKAGMFYNKKTNFYKSDVLGKEIKIDLRNIILIDLSL